MVLMEMPGKGRGFGKPALGLRVQLIACRMLEMKRVLDHPSLRTWAMPWWAVHCPQRRPMVLMEMPGKGRGFGKPALGLRVQLIACRMLEMMRVLGHPSLRIWGMTWWAVRCLQRRCMGWQRTWKAAIGSESAAGCMQDPDDDAGVGPPIPQDLGDDMGRRAVPPEEMYGLAEGLESRHWV